LRKYKTAVDGLQTSEIAFKDLDQSVDLQNREIWSEDERKAMMFRGEYLTIYNVKKEKGLRIPLMFQVHLIYHGNQLHPSPKSRPSWQNKRASQSYQQDQSIG
jgi:hypothetical protein